MFLPAAERVAEAAALEIGRAMNLSECEVIHKRVMHPAEGTLIELKGRLDVAIDPATLVIPEPVEVLTDDEIRDFVHERALKVVAATVGEDEHSVGMREIIDIKHGGLEKWGFAAEYLGTSVPIEKVLDAAIEHAAQVVLISTIITHNDVHRENMQKLADLAVEKGVRDKLLLIAGGTQVTDKLACEWGMDAGLRPQDQGHRRASFIVKTLRREAGDMSVTAGTAIARRVCVDASSPRSARRPRSSPPSTGWPASRRPSRGSSGRAWPRPRCCRATSASAWRRRAQSSRRRRGRSSPP